MKTRFIILTAILALSVGAARLTAQIPRTLSYQGVLTDNAGKPRPDGSYTFKFCLYGSNSGGSPIWCESKSLPVKSGLFSTVLGEQTPFGAAVKFDKQYWLGIQVGSEAELSPRIALTSVGYSFSSLRADTASVAVASLADTTWRHSGANIYRANGNVGIGTTSPAAKLDVAGDARIQGSIDMASESNHTLNSNGRLHITGAEALYLLNKSGVIISKSFGGNGNLAVEGDIDLSSESNHTLNSNGRLHITGAEALYLLNKSGVIISKSFGGNGNLAVEGDIDLSSESNHTLNSNGRLQITGAEALYLLNKSGVIISKSFGGTGDLIVEGKTRTSILEITGGSDLAEPFKISESQPIPKGALVIIDEEKPGQLKLSHQAYDKRVAGVVSGAGGINPGLTLTQQGVMEGGQNVALSGRVYALSTAANGPIKPGDLLTTSEVPGYAMKATDRELWPGAVIGKAMSSLEGGEGLVLVLVNLQ